MCGFGVDKKRTPRLLDASHRGVLGCDRLNLADALVGRVAELHEPVQVDGYSRRLNLQEVARLHQVQGRLRVANPGAFDRHGDPQMRVRAELDTH